MFDINEYNIPLMFFVFGGVNLLLLLLFRRKISSLVDPLVLHLVWISSLLAFLSGYSDKHGVTVLVWMFALISIAHILMLNLLLSDVSHRIGQTRKIGRVYLQHARLYTILYYLFLLVVIYSKRSFFLFAFSNPSIKGWFMYKYIEIQASRDPVLRILEFGGEGFFAYFTFIMLLILKRHRMFVGSMMLMYTLIQVISGGRGAVIGIAFSLGFFVYFHIGCINISLHRMIKRFSLIFLMVGVFFAVFVSSFFASEFSLEDGMKIMLNRFIASADGLEYYMNYDGMTQIKSGLIEYCYSFAGIVIKKITGTEYKNIGWQLTELVEGPTDFAKGANYMVHLQVMVLGYYLMPLYVIFITVIAARLRQLRTNHPFLLPLCYFISSNGFGMLIDIETWFIRSLAGILLYTGLILVICKIYGQRRAGSIGNNLQLPYGIVHAPQDS